MSSTDGQRIQEKERRRSDIKKMGGHRLRKIVLQCIKDSSEERPSAEEVSEWLQNEWSKIQQKRRIADNSKGPKLEIAVLGQAGAGKSCLISRYVDHRFNCEFIIPTISPDLFHTGVTLHGIEYRLQIVDTAGQEKFFSIIPNSIRHAQGVVLVFDITNRSSFEVGIPQMLEMVRAHAPDGTSLILVGNKADLADQDTQKRKREIAKEEAEHYAQRLGICYVETSALSGQNIEALFELITNDIYDTLDLSDIDIYVPSAGRDRIKVTNVDAPRNRNFIDRIGDCFTRIKSWIWSNNTN